MLWLVKIATRILKLKGIMKIDRLKFSIFLLFTATLKCSSDITVKKAGLQMIEEALCEKTQETSSASQKSPTVLPKNTDIQQVMPYMLIGKIMTARYNSTNQHFPSVRLLPEEAIRAYARIGPSVRLFPEEAILAYARIGMYSGKIGNWSIPLLPKFFPDLVASELIWVRATKLYLEHRVSHASWLKKSWWRVKKAFGKIIIPDTIQGLDTYIKSCEKPVNQTVPA